MTDPSSQPVSITYAEEWAIDSLDRVLMGRFEDAKTSLSFANLSLLKAPPGSSYRDLEAFLHVLWVKVYHTTDSNTPS